jgi:glycosyltransferase involved in cell wall biosynthesis
LSIRGRTLRAFARPGVDRWIVLSESNRELLARSRTTGDDAISVVHPGLPVDRFHELPNRAVAAEGLGIDPRSLIVGTIGRLSAQKRHDVLIDAAERAATQVAALKLVIVGDGELSGVTRRLAEGDLPGQVVFTGQRADAIQLLPAFDVFAMSSDFEGLPFALLEAMGSGRAIVTTDVQGAGEAVRHEREGLLVPRRDPEALAAAIVRLARDRNLADQLAQAARERFLAEFTADVMVERTEALYLELLAARKDQR